MVDLADRWTERQIDRQMESECDGQMDKQTNGQINSVRKNIYWTKMTERHIYLQKNGQKNTLKWVEIQTDR
jgi:hypothetical protein